MFLAVVIAARHISIVSPSLSRVVLENNDQVSAGGHGQAVFISVQPYFFFGDLRVSAENMNTTITAVPGARYHFSDTNVTLSFTNSANTVKLTLFVLPTAELGFCKSSFTISSKSATYSRVVGLDEQVCVAFDFDVPPTLDSVGGGVTALRVVDGHVVPKHLNLTHVGESLDPMFIAMVSFGELTLKTDQIRCDWNEQDVPFLWCNKVSCDSVPFEGFIESKRKVKAWVLVVAYSVAALIVIGCCVPMCLPRRVQMSLLSTNRHTGLPLQLTTETLSVQITSPSSYTG